MIPCKKYKEEMKQRKGLLIKARQDKDQEMSDAVMRDITYAFIRRLAGTDFDVETHPLWVACRAQEILDMID